MEALQESWQWIVTFSAERRWVVEVFAIVLAATVAHFLLSRILRRLYIRLSKSWNVWDDAFVDALRVPLTALIWVVGIAYAAEVVGRHTETEVFRAIDIARSVAVIAMLTWFLIRLTGRVQLNIIHYREAAGETVDHTTVDAVSKLVRVSIFITAVLVTLQTLGLNISAVLAFGGIGGIAVGFAAKDLLANFFGGLMIYMDRPFAVGEWVRSPDREIEGVVEEIGWRLTRIRTFDKRLLYVPNATFNSISLQNPSRMSHRRIYETIGVRYDDASKVRNILEDTKNMLQEHPELDQSQTLIVNFNEFGASSLNFFIYTFTRTVVWSEYHAVKEDVLLKILDIIEGHGAEVAFPTSTLHVPEVVRIAEERRSASSGGDERE